MLRFELRHYMYLPPIFKPRIMSPLNRGSGLFVRFPGVPPLTRLHRRATIYRRPGSDFGGHSSAGYPLQIAIWRVFRGPQFI